jgi:hypothetical protein
MPKQINRALQNRVPSMPQKIANLYWENTFNTTQKKFRASQNWMPLMKPRKIKTQLITTTNSVVQKEEEPNQTLVYINILMHIHHPR